MSARTQTASSARPSGESAWSPGRTILRGRLDATELASPRA